MSEDKQADNDPERTLVTLDQLSQTIEVMTSVVNRLRQHLSEQLQAKASAEKAAEAEAAVAEEATGSGQSAAAGRESFVVEIRQQEPEPENSSDKTVH